MNYPPALAPKPNGPWIMQVPVISTGHLPQADCDLLYADKPLLLSPPVFDPPTALIAIEDPPDNLPWDQLAETTRTLITGLRQLGYHYLRLDPDGDTIPGLPTFDW